MTESEWRECRDPRAMLEFLQDGAVLSERKLRLFAVACCRRIWARVDDERSRKAVEVSERSADGLATHAERCEAEEASDTDAPDGPEKTAEACACAYAILPFLEPDDLSGAVLDAGFAAQNAAEASAWQGAHDAERYRLERRSQCDLLRDLFGPFPLRSLPVLTPDMLQWNGSTVARLAQAAYDERLMPSGELDPARLAVLADALDEAGCTDAEVLGHLRSPGPHIRGCWTVDLLIGGPNRCHC